LIPYFLALLLGLAEAPPAGSSCGTGRSAAVAGDFLQEINALRAKRKLDPLRLHPSLCRFARERAREIAAAGESEFDLLSDEDLFRRAEEAGYRPRYLAEMEIQAEGSAETVVSTWPGNVKATALDRGARDLGVGVEQLGDSPLYALFFGLSLDEDFARRTVSLTDRESVIRDMLDSLNAERRKARLHPLRVHPALAKAAQRHADDMLARSFYGHETPEGRTPLDRARAAGYVPLSIAENIARGQFSVDEVMEGWMHSPVHRANIVSRDFSQVGFGVAYGINGTGPTVVWVQLFGAPPGG
jgi:uncharacterized protein YkwD